MTGDLKEVDISRMTRLGVKALSTEQGLKLFDSALGASESLLLPAFLDLQALRAQARAGALPSLFAGLVRVTTRRASEHGASLARAVAMTPESEREDVALELVSAQVATVLGHASPDSIDAQRTFKELGFDSLAAVELRNRLNAVTGLHLPATLVFDYPTTTAITSYLLEQLVEDRTAALGDAELDQLEQVLASIASDGTERVRITGRLQALLSQLAQPRPESGGGAVSKKIDMASDDELFRYLDEKAYASRSTHSETPDSSDRREHDDG